MESAACPNVKNNFDIYCLAWGICGYDWSVRLTNFDFFISIPGQDPTTAQPDGACPGDRPARPDHGTSDP